MTRDTSEPTLHGSPGADDAPGRGSAGAPRGASAGEGASGGEGANGKRAGERDGDGRREPRPGARAAGEQGGGAAEIEGDLDELVATAAQRDEYLALAQRTQADFENYRKRVARDAALAQERGVAKIVKELLPALDDIDRALEEAGTDGVDDDALRAGVRLVRDGLTSALARVGVESFSPVGEPFDPELHEAMAQQPVPGAASGTVAEVYQPGYRLGDHVIRPARVVVAA
ncbi:MAG TPA: nucleotide exchange factor GrpE [Solirubrobacteraceae bacterium]|nr:nucleotide exchange factor GrpE [Solirubrobacteraceae bacterium]